MRFYRTPNYFRVKSRAAFQEFLQRNGCELLICEPGKVGFQGSKGAPLPQGRRLSEPERVLAFEEELSSHLREGEIAIVMEVTADPAAGVDEGWIRRASTRHRQPRRDAHPRPAGDFHAA
jgi:hypothetical protein